MSTSAKSLVPAATRAIASGDPLAILVLTASPSEPNKPLLAASTNGAALASIGRSRENWIATGGRVSPGARHSPAPNPSEKTSRPSSERRKQRTALVEFARIAITSGGPDPVAAPAMFVSWRHEDAGRWAFCRIEPERPMSCHDFDTDRSARIRIGEPNMLPVVSHRGLPGQTTTEDIEMFARKNLLLSISRAAVVATVAAVAVTALSRQRLAPDPLRSPDQGRRPLRPATSDATDFSSRRRYYPRRWRCRGRRPFAGIVGTGIAIAATQNRRTIMTAALAITAAAYGGPPYYGGGLRRTHLLAAARYDGGGLWIGRLWRTANAGMPRSTW